MGGALGRTSRVAVEVEVVGPCSVVQGFSCCRTLACRSDWSE